MKFPENETCRGDSRSMLKANRKGRASIHEIRQKNHNRWSGTVGSIREQPQMTCESCCRSYYFSDYPLKQLSVRRWDGQWQPGKHRHQPNNLHHVLPKIILLSRDKGINEGGTQCKAISPLWQPDLSRQFCFAHIWMGVSSSHQHTVLLVVQHSMGGGCHFYLKSTPRIQMTHERYNVIHPTSSEWGEKPHWAFRPLPQTNLFHQHRIPDAGDQVRKKNKCLSSLCNSHARLWVGWWFNFFFPTVNSTGS